MCGDDDDDDDDDDDNGDDDGYLLKTYAYFETWIQSKTFKVNPVNF